MENGTDCATFTRAASPGWFYQVSSPPALYSQVQEQLTNQFKLHLYLPRYRYFQCEAAIGLSICKEMGAFHPPTELMKNVRALLWDRVLQGV